MRTRNLNREADVKDEVLGVIKRLDKAFSWAPPGGAFGKAGMPDRMIIYEGKVIAIECKFGDNKPTIAQRTALNRIRDAGGLAFIYYGGMPNELYEHITRLQPYHSDCVIQFRNGDVTELDSIQN